MKNMQLSRNKSRPLIWVYMVMGVLLLSACGTRSVKPEAITDEFGIDQDMVIAQDFISVMAQIESLSPWTAVLHVGLASLPENLAEGAGHAKRRNELFERALRTTATQNGYEIRTVQDASAPNFVRFSISDPVEIDGLQTYTYDLSVGDVDFRRVYTPGEDGRVVPYKAMLVRGADASAIESDDSIFEQHNERQYQSIHDQSVAQTEPDQRSEFKSPLQSKRIPEPQEQAVIVEPVMTASFSARKAVTEKPPTVEATEDKQFNLVRKANIADTGSSNYENLLFNKQDIARQTLIFADDSYVLGVQNKRLIGKMMSDFNPETDVVSVVGCSTGPTKIENGNAALAIGRANRVKEALLYGGIPNEKIYDEGCWSPTVNSTPFPNRGVVITIKRKPG